MRVIMHLRVQLSFAVSGRVDAGCSLTHLTMSQQRPERLG